MAVAAENGTAVVDLAVAEPTLETAFPGAGSSSGPGYSPGIGAPAGTPRR